MVELQAACRVLGRTLPNTVVDGLEMCLDLLTASNMDMKRGRSDRSFQGAAETPKRRQ